MAVINQILHRKNSSGSYDTVYLKANMANVTGVLAIANGGTGASEITNVTPVDIPEPYVHPSTKQCNYNVDLSNYYTKSEVNNMTGGPVTPIPAPSSHTPGDIITWDEKEWLVCHYDSTNNQVYLIAKDILDKCFGFSAVSQTPAIQYEKYNMSKGALLQCVPTTVSGITSKVFVPSYNQMNGGFSWFNSDTNRIANYRGSVYFYWASSPNDSGRIWRVTNSGSLDINYGPGDSLGFRPCVCVQL